MDATKRLFENLSLSVLIIYLILFPFGQLVRIPAIFLGRNITLHPTDIIAGLSIPIVFFAGYKFPSFFRYVSAFLVICLFSAILSFFYPPSQKTESVSSQMNAKSFPLRQDFAPNEAGGEVLPSVSSRELHFDAASVIAGSFYLLRLFSYIMFFVLVRNLLKTGRIKKEILLDLLVFSLLATALFGWVQYFFVFDVRSLKYVGWDDHLGRIVGTFFDPGFIGIILLLGFLVTTLLFLEKREKQYFLASLLFLVTIAFTYSRATYISFFTSMGLFFFARKHLKQVLIFICIFAILLFLVPRIASEGTRLERTASVVARGQNYYETLEIIKKYPLFGVGFNNVCNARLSFFGGEKESHACSGSDSSLLLILATSGVVGTISFLYACYKILTNLEKDTYGLIFLTSTVAIFIHSIFVQSLFYPWIMGSMGILLAATSFKKLRSKANF